MLSYLKIVDEKIDWIKQMLNDQTYESSDAPKVEFANDKYHR